MTLFLTSNRVGTAYHPCALPKLNYSILELVYILQSDCCSFKMSSGGANLVDAEVLETARRRRRSQRQQRPAEEDVDDGTEGGNDVTNNARGGSNHSEDEEDSDDNVGMDENDEDFKE